MSYQSKDLIAKTRGVREASGVSQRVLSERSGLTQSHISQIESGKMEPGLSSFVDMTRALDLELMLVPKKLVPAVDAILRSQEAQEGSKPAGKRLARAERTVRKLKQIYGSSADLDHIDDAMHFFLRASLSERDTEQVRDLIARLERHQASEQAAPVLREIAQDLQRLRNAIVHARPMEPKPAWSLDEDGDA